MPLATNSSAGCSGSTPTAPQPCGSSPPAWTATLDAVTAGLTLSYSSGPVEGTVNRIKMIKRQMFGRANFDLLRKRGLLAT
jgi:hypothetical protein